MDALYAECLIRLRELLSWEYNCAPEDFSDMKNVLTVPALHPGRRQYSDEPYYFHMVTLGENAVITADPELHPFLLGFQAGRTGHWLFELPNLMPLERELEARGYTLTSTYHMFLPCKGHVSVGDWACRWFPEAELRQFYGDSRFPNAILDRYHPERPDRLALCAYDGEKIMGMAGCSEDAAGWFQIGIDVMPEYRSRGIGTALVAILKDRILAEGGIPFYGTSVSNYHSWNVALNCGFRPAWVEIGAKKRETP